MRIAKKILKYILYFLLVPTTYFIFSLVLSLITVDRIDTNEEADKTIYLHTNGVHLDVIIPKKDVNSLVLTGIRQYETENYLSFGWGEENFYINTPNWSDLTFSNAVRAMFLKNSTLVHVTRYKKKRTDWVEIKITQSELDKLNAYLLRAFKTDGNGMKIMLINKGYSPIDDFYKAEGSYSCFKTCNSWVNTGFKQSGLKSCLWTPFDFGLLNKYN